MTIEEGYNGWKNYETWSVALILDNDQGLQAEAYAVCRGIAPDSPYAVADAFKDWIEREADDAVEISDREPLSYLWSQLIGAALSEVDWDEIEAHYREGASVR